jgi:ribosome-binding factor A
METESADASLQGFYVDGVEPAPNASRLLVVLRQWDHARGFDLADILQRLAAAKGYWRSEVARAINRKKTPDLVFQVLLTEAEQ